MIVSQRATGMCSTSPRPTSPALLTRMSRPPNRSTAKRIEPAADLFAREIPFDVLRLAARRLHAADRLEAVVAIQPVHHDVGAEPGEVLRDAAADARTSIR